MYYDFNSAIFAALLAFGAAIILGPIAIPILRRLKFGQNVRDDGPQTHLAKQGIPSMGGIVIIAATFIGGALFSGMGYTFWLLMFPMLSFGAIGFCDDFIKIVKKRSMGLRSWQKFIMQIAAGVGFVLLLRHFEIDTRFFLPFTAGRYIDFGWFTPIFILLVMGGTTNGANFTDGLDGLASGVTMLITIFFLYVSIAMDSSLTPILGAGAGALLGFLLFNSYPARVFMGDTGSLALGGFVAGAAIILQQPLLIPIVAFVYFVEVASSFLQTAWYKYTKRKYGKGRRLFKMAPIHHHFEMMGWPETRVVAVFYIVTAILCLLGIVAVSNFF
ncbi:MAG: phospho-N-acetylmuramoyl-pentapeptide-transferase [Defluviitaleaceae bacterium]|nr:phospho-N-acetylmuramoyl-pentapeptide-transferase [Defluviitaleaceae bacterium]